MAISARSVEIIEKGFKNIFGGTEIKYTDRKDDGGYENIGLIVTEIDSWQFKRLKELTDQVSNSFTMIHRADGIKLWFF